MTAPTPPPMYGYDVADPRHPNAATRPARLLLGRAIGRAYDQGTASYNEGDRYASACYDAAGDVLTDVVRQLLNLPTRPAWRRWGARFANMVSE